MRTIGILHLTLAALLFAADNARADQTKLLIVRSGSRPPGTTIVPPTKYSDTAPVYWNPPNGQHIIPRYANGVTHPAGQLLGWGPTSVVQGTIATESLPSESRAIVVTEDFDQEIGGWEYTSAKRKAVLQPVVRDLTIAGRDAAGTNYATAGQVNDAGEGPLGNGDDPTLYNGLLWKASAGFIENVNFFSIPGKAAVIKRGPAGVKNAGLGIFDNEKLKIWNVNIARCFYGIDIDVNDATIGNISGHSIRSSSGSGGYGLKLSVGATQIAGYLHFWGAEKTYGLPALEIGVDQFIRKPRPKDWYLTRGETDSGQSTATRVLSARLKLTAATTHLGQSTFTALEIHSRSEF